MDSTGKNEVEHLKKQLACAHKELKLTSTGFVSGGMACGYLVQWLIKDNHLVVPAILPAIILAAVLGGSLWAVLLVSIYRLRGYLAMRRTERERLQDELFKTTSTQVQQL
jgi:hypothetical protein